MSGLILIEHVSLLYLGWCVEVTLKYFVWSTIFPNFTASYMRQIFAPFFSDLGFHVPFLLSSCSCRSVLEQEASPFLLPKCHFVVNLFLWPASRLQVKQVTLQEWRFNTKCLVNTYKKRLHHFTYNLQTEGARGRAYFESTFQHGMLNVF